MPGIKITDKDRQRIDAKFICASCNDLLHFPMQTMCGLLMCQSCIEDLLKNSNPKCPKDGEELSEEKVFLDAFTKRELNGLHLHCANPGCSWQSTYDKLEGHSLVCEHALINCVHSKCKVKFQRSLLGEHLKNDCEYRNVKCEYCQKDIAFASIKEHVDSSCENAPVTCKYCGESVLRKDIERHEKEICKELPATCDFQAIGCSHNQTLKRGKLRQHLNGGLINHVQLLLHYVLASYSKLSNYTPRTEFAETMQKIRDDITDVRSCLAEKFVMLVGKLTGLERRIETMESSGERIMSLERELRDKMLLNERLQRRLDQIDESLALNTVKITDLESSGGGNARLKNEVSEMSRRVRDVTSECTNLRERNMSLERQFRDKMSTMTPPQCREDVKLQRDMPWQQAIHSYNGILLWKIESYQRKRQDAIKGVKTFLYSPPFCTAQFGYKMCAKIYMNGDGSGRGSHLSLFFVVMRGDYDALQTWPFQKKITMMLLDQGNGDHLIDAFHSDPQSSSFQCPKSDMNIASGSPLFMPLDSLNNRQYIKDDVMFIKVIVD